MTLIIFMYLFSLFYSVLVVLTTVCKPKSLSGTIRNIHSIQHLNSRWHVLEPLTPSFGSTRLQTVQLHWTDLKRATLFIKLTEVLQLLPSQPSKKKDLSVDMWLHSACVFIVPDCFFWFLQWDQWSCLDFVLLSLSVWGSPTHLILLKQTFLPLGGLKAKHTHTDRASLEYNQLLSLLWLDGPVWLCSTSSQWHILLKDRHLKTTHS